MSCVVGIRTAGQGEESAWYRGGWRDRSPREEDAEDRKGRDWATGSGNCISWVPVWSNGQNEEVGEAATRENGTCRCWAGWGSGKHAVAVSESRSGGGGGVWKV